MSAFREPVDINIRGLTLFGIRLESEHGDQIVQLVFIVVIEKLLEHLFSFEKPAELILAELEKVPHRWSAKKMRKRGRSGLA